MKLVIQIPCWNESATIGSMLSSLPTVLPGVDSIEVIVIDDGSQDDTARVALAFPGVTVVPLPRHLGLAAAFNAGVAEALRRNADILVNTDADGQYPSNQIAQLIAPLLQKKADMVVGNRLSQNPPPFGPLKMALQRLGSFIMRRFSATPIADAASGFRAFNRDLLESMIIHSEFSYTLESLMLAGMNHFRVVNVPISTIASTRKSRLFRNIPQYIRRSVITIVRAYLMYHPLRFFVNIGSISLGAAFILGARFLAYYLAGQGAGHIQSLILVAIFAIWGFLCIAIGLLADVVAANRRLLEGLRRKHLYNEQTHP